MKVKLLFSILVCLAVAPFAGAAGLSVVGTCDRIDFSYPGQWMSGGAILQSMDCVRKEGVPISSCSSWYSFNKFTDLGENSVNRGIFSPYYFGNYFPLGRIIPNNEYSYVVSVPEGGVPIWPPQSGVLSVDVAVKAKSACYPIVGIAKNEATSPSVPLAVNTDNDSDKIHISFSGISDFEASLSVNLDKLNLGHYPVMTELKEGIATITYKKRYRFFRLPWFGYNITAEKSFLCLISSCDVDVDYLNFPQDPNASTGGEYSYSYSYDVYKLSSSAEDAVIGTDMSYDLLRNGQEIARNVPASKTSFIDKGLTPGTEYSYTVRAPSIYSREGITGLPLVIKDFYAPGFYLSAYAGSKSPFVKDLIPLPAPAIRSISVKTSGIFPRRAAVVLDINIPYEAAGEYRTAGFLSMNGSCRGWSNASYAGISPRCSLGCISVSGFPDNCWADYTPEKVTTVVSDKTYDIFRQENGDSPIEAASRISITQRSFSDTNLKPSTLYLYTIRIPSAHSRDGLSGGSIGIPEQAPTQLPALASPVQATISVLTKGGEVPDTKDEIDDKDADGDKGAVPGTDDSGGGSSAIPDFGEDSKSELPPGFVPGIIHEVRP